jgi:hypothetical protein
MNLAGLVAEFGAGTVAGVLVVGGALAIGASPGITAVMGFGPEYWRKSFTTKFMTKVSVIGFLTKTQSLRLTVFPNKSLSPLAKRI